MTALVFIPGPSREQGLGKVLFSGYVPGGLAAAFDVQVTLVASNTEAWKEGGDQIADQREEQAVAVRTLWAILSSLLGHDNQMCYSSYFLTLPSPGLNFPF